MDGAAMWLDDGDSIDHFLAARSCSYRRRPAALSGSWHHQYLLCPPLLSARLRLGAAAGGPPPEPPAAAAAGLSGGEPAQQWLRLRLRQRAMQGRQRNDCSSSRGRGRPSSFPGRRYPRSSCLTSPGAGPTIPWWVRPWVSGAGDSTAAFGKPDGGRKATVDTSRSR